MVVGAYKDDDSGTDSGSAYLFERPLGGWGGEGALTETRKLLALGGEPQDDFGRSTAISGDIVVVGADLDDDDDGTDSGSAYVFRKPAEGWSGDGPLTTAQKLLAWDGTSFDHFGITADFAGETLIIGAPGGVAGAAYVFQLDGITLRRVAKLLPSDGLSNDCFGHDVAISGDTALVGAPNHDNDQKPDSGAAYVFHGLSNGVIPVVSTWGTAAMTLLLLTAGTLVCTRRRWAQA